MSALKALIRAASLINGSYKSGNYGIVGYQSSYERKCRLIALIRTLEKDKSSMENLKPPLPLPLPVHRALERVGEDMNRARRRRGLSQKDLAQRIGASVSTVKRMESGDPKIQFQFIARALHLFGELQRLTQLLDSSQDDIGLTLMDSQLPQRIHRVKKSKTVKAF